MIRRVFDIIISFLALIIFLVPSLVIAFLIFWDDGLPVLFKQKRVGKGGKLFDLLKFRTMRTDNENNIDLTAGDNAKRITSSGAFLRKYKLDEIPQFINVFKGDMSIVGPRPEVPYFVDMYDLSQREVLQIKPGITDWASIEYKNESETLEKETDPLSYYIHYSIPRKITLNKKFINDPSIGHYFKIIIATILQLFKK